MHKISYKRLDHMINKTIMRIDDPCRRDEIYDLYKKALSKEDLDDIRQLCVAYRRYEDKMKILSKRLIEYNFQYESLMNRFEEKE